MSQFDKPQSQHFRPGKRKSAKLNLKGKKNTGIFVVPLQGLVIRVNLSAMVEWLGQKTDIQPRSWVPILPHP
jgi:hypothetical protein